MMCCHYVPEIRLAPCAPAGRPSHLPHKGAIERIDALVVAAADQLAHGADEAGARRAHDLLSIARELVDVLRAIEQRRHAHQVSQRVRG